MENKAEDKNVQKFLYDVMETDNEKFNILEELRNSVFTHCKTTHERMMYGGIMFSNEKDWGGIFVYKSHVSFEFSEGFKLNDPNKLLQGTGKKRRHLKIYSLSDIPEKKVAFFVKQVLALN
ncbi:DUF1801 domain-containing protein [Carnobacterium funditum]|uniref:DUF1801 domain-containing protein n=1 Tax=Carnobacterium funditum TaxID=2752 RepID=UPI000557572A|nr:DUF1801 domain-containing protein [Carnobacterium funditum]